MRTDAVFKRAYNQCLELCASMTPGARLGSELTLAQKLDVSRTTVRKIADALLSSGVARVDDDGVKVIARHPRSEEFFPDDETEDAHKIVEKGFMNLVLHEEIRPGQHISTIALARRLGVSTSIVREYLSGFGQFGLIEKRSNGSWVFLGFDQQFAEELSDVRELFELRSAEAFCDLPLGSAVWTKLTQLEQAHEDALADIENHYKDFPHLDQQFHEVVNSVKHNRFVSNFDAIRSFIFHYHYQWSKHDDKERNTTAIIEHLDYIKALRTRDRAMIRAASLKHIRTARKNLLRSIERYRQDYVAGADDLTGIPADSQG